MPKLTLALDELKVDSLPVIAEPQPVDALATANTCYRSCLVTACFC